MSFTNDLNVPALAECVRSQERRDGAFKKLFPIHPLEPFRILIGIHFKPRSTLLYSGQMPNLDVTGAHRE
jgi:hypothetical protein